jgi:carboxymethylenebutenolidase
MSHSGNALDRRQFLGAWMAASLVLTARPIFAGTPTVHTDSDGLVAEDVKIPVQGGEIAGYVAYPSKGKDFPAILVGHDVFGIDEQMKDVVRRLAKLGYYAICPNLFSRAGDLSKVTDELPLFSTVNAKLADADVLSDLDSTVAFVKKSGKGDVKHLGMTGFGWGGRAVWLYAAHDQKLAAGVSFYGFLGASRDPKGLSPIALSSKIKSPVLGIYGSKDDYILESDAKTMANGLAGNKKAEIIILPGVKHGFFADDQKSYDAKTAEDAWNRMKIWFYNNGLR